MNSSGNLRFSRSFREGMGEFLEIRNLVILITIPVLVALASLVEGQLEAQGIIGPFSRSHTLRMLLWNVSLVVALVALVKGCLVFGKLWSFDGGMCTRGRIATVLGSVASLFFVYFFVTCIMGIAVMMASDGFHLSALLFLVGWCTPPLIWSVCLAGVVSLLTDGPAAAWLGGAVFHLALVPGLFGRSPHQLIVPPMGSLVTSTINGFFRPGMLLVVLLHSVVCLGLAVLTYLVRSRPSRRWQ